MAIKCKDRAYDLNKDRISLTFEFGQNPSMVKGTKAVTEMLQKRDFSMNDTWEALFDRRLGQRKNWSCTKLSTQQSSYHFKYMHKKSQESQNFFGVLLWIEFEFSCNADCLHIHNLKVQDMSKNILLFSNLYYLYHAKGNLGWSWQI